MPNPIYDNMIGTMMATMWSLLKAADESRELQEALEGALDKERQDKRMLGEVEFYEGKMREEGGWTEKCDDPLHESLESLEGWSQTLETSLREIKQILKEFKVV